MANKDTKPEQVDINAPVSLTAKDLMDLFSVMQNTNAKTLAEALEKLSPHYISPEQKANEESLKKSTRDMEIYKLKNRKRQQRLCEHEIGQNGRKRLGEGSFFMLKLPTGETIGICSYCQKVISSTNPDDMRYFRKAGGTLAEAGQFTLAEPIKAQLARLSPDERKRVLAAREEFQRNNPADSELEEELI